MLFDHMDFRSWLLRILFLIAFPLTYLSMQLNPVKRTNRLLNVEFSQVTSPLECIKCYCLSDLHADTEKNQLWVREKCIRKQEDINAFTVFLLPGDVGSELDRLESVFRHLTANYDAVVYVPGNHEAWRRGIAAGGSATRPEERAENANRMAENSVVKLQEVLDCARACGVYVGPLRVQLDRGTPMVDNSINRDTTKTTTTNPTSSSSTSTVNGSESPTIDSSSPCGAVIFPLYSWYHSGWDKEPELVHPDFLAVEAVMPFARKWGDFAMCSWPEDVISQSDFSSTLVDNTVLAQAFAEINEPFLYPKESLSTTTSPSSSSSTSSSSSSSGSSSSTNSIRSSSSSSSTGSKEDSSSSSSSGRFDHDTPLVHAGDSVISFSHFLPRQELCPEKRFLLEPLLTKVVGSDFLEQQVRRLRPHVHLFGHTHIPIDLTLEGIRYIQWPLGYSREADKQCAPIHRTGPLLVFDSTLGQVIIDSTIVTLHVV